MRHVLCRMYWRPGPGGGAVWVGDRALWEEVWGFKVGPLALCFLCVDEWQSVSFLTYLSASHFCCYAFPMWWTVCPLEFQAKNTPFLPCSAFCHGILSQWLESMQSEPLWNSLFIPICFLFWLCSFTNHLVCFLRMALLPFDFSSEPGLFLHHGSRGHTSCLTQKSSLTSKGPLMT